MFYLNISKEVYCFTLNRKYCFRMIQIYTSKIPIKYKFLFELQPAKETGRGTLPISTAFQPTVITCKPDYLNHVTVKEVGSIATFLFHWARFKEESQGNYVFRDDYLNLHFNNCFCLKYNFSIRLSDDPHNWTFDN